MKAHDFKERPRHDKTKRMDNALFVKMEDLDLDDPKYNWIQVGYEKYGRFMYCTNNHIRRGLTMGEFYGGGIVD